MWDLCTNSKQTEWNGIRELWLCLLQKFIQDSCVAIILLLEDLLTLGNDSNNTCGAEETVLARRSAKQAF